mgnify:CR=1 FL=1
MHTLAGLDEVIPVLAISGGIFIAIISILITNLRGMLATRATEQTRREIAAYVAEGTITPEEAERLLKAGPGKARQGGC